MERRFVNARSAKRWIELADCCGMRPRAIITLTSPDTEARGLYCSSPDLDVGDQVAAPTDAVLRVILNRLVRMGRYVVVAPRAQVPA